MKKATDNCICMVIGWPDTLAKGAEKFMTWCHKVGIIKDVYFKVGHAAMCLIHKETGKIEYFDFGRYTCDTGQGRARGMNTDPALEIKVKAKIDQNGKMINVQELVDFLFKIDRFTHGEGQIYFSLYGKMNYEKTMEYVDHIQQQGSVRYTTFMANSTNCSRFVCDAIIAGSSVEKDKRRLVYTPTYKASPIGNAVDVGYESNVYRQKDIDSPLENFKMTRWDNLKLIWNNNTRNFKGKKIVRPNKIDEVPRHESILGNAEWLGGLGEGNWVSITPVIYKGQACFRATAQYEDGMINYDTIVKAKDTEVDSNLPFSVTYDCSRLFVTILQANKKIRLFWLKDYKDVNTKLINTPNSKISIWT